jgi:hypothetical protein
MTRANPDEIFFFKYDFSLRPLFYIYIFSWLLTKMWVERTIYSFPLFVKKKEDESLPSILITRNPNLSQSLDKKTDCV